MMFYNHYKTIVISDIALGASPEHFKKLITFIKSTSCDKLIFCGDIIKGWQDQKVNTLSKYHNNFLKALLKHSEKNNSKIIFITGSEWDFQDTIPYFSFSNISFVKEYKFNSGGNTIYLFPEELTSFFLKSNFKISPVENYKYHLLLWVNKKYNSYRINHGKEYFSLLKIFKPLLQKDLPSNYDLENLKATFAGICQLKESNGIICGHPLETGIFYLGENIFMSAGFWTESLTALAESNYGQWQTLSYNEVMEQKLEALKYENMVEAMFREL